MLCSGPSGPRAGNNNDPDEKSITHLPERQVTALDDLRVECDLYLLKSGTELALSLGGALHTLGVATLNPYPTVALMRNKIILTRLLQQAGVPTPATYAALHPGELAPLLHCAVVLVE